MSYWFLLALIAVLFVAQTAGTLGLTKRDRDINLAHKRHDKLMARFEREIQERAKLRKQVVQTQSKLRRLEGALRKQMRSNERKE